MLALPAPYAPEKRTTGTMIDNLSKNTYICYMPMQKKHKISYLGPSIFIVLLLLFAFSFYEILIKSPEPVFHYELASVSSNAIVLNKIQQFSINKNWLPQLDNSNFKVITDRIKLLTNNKLILQKVNFLQQVELSVTFIIPPGFYYHYYHRSAEYLPVSA